MAYEKQTWVNNDPSTPLSASRMSHIETGIEDAHQRVDEIDLSGFATLQDLSSGLEGKADVSHNHDGTYATVSQLSGKADADHGHEQSEIVGLTAALASKADADHNHDGVYATVSQLNSKADVDHDHDGEYATPAQVNAKADSSHTHGISDITDLQNQLDALSARLDALETE